MSAGIKEILYSSCSDKTWKQYDCILRKYINFCKINFVNHNPWKPNIKIVLEFLYFLYNNGLGYVSLNSARSALSTVLGRIDEFPLGSHPIITRFMKGISRMRPPKAKYTVTWDPQEVLDNLQSLKDNEHLSVRDLTRKLVALMLLGSGQRVQTLHNIKLNEISFSTNSCLINVTNRLKHTRTQSGQALHFQGFSNKKLCVLTCLRIYIEITKDLRKCDYLFIQSRSPHRRASVQTISKWAKEILCLAGIDTSIFSSHSFRHASTSKASLLGVSLDSVFKCAGWSDRSSVFARFYNRPIVNKNEFSNAVLNAK